MDWNASIIVSQSRSMSSIEISKFPQTINHFQNVRYEEE
jgi:hypothetical protein